MQIRSFGFFVSVENPDTKKLPYQIGYDSFFSVQN
ncbi:hypothetical protein RO1_13680 [Roseburia intestinalis XB6B4]|uniref:Uncharacterized protein n=1 Tax=Roseburia intestinalis XB6B4 TaxID=718255 RepID=D4KXA7_9FIRM|nr:hypothetical protein ROI_23860 [Roseburia intestinalis M50/1]CBL11997.1 hypothetical protein RO1_13680 [Roseburia intestinalis XB6B4]